MIRAPAAAADPRRELRREGGGAGGVWRGVGRGGASAWGGARGGARETSEREVGDAARFWMAFVIMAFSPWANKRLLLVSRRAPDGGPSGRRTRACWRAGRAP